MRLLVCTFLSILTLFLSNGYTQEYTTWGLPDGAKSRLGKGEIAAITFSPDGSLIAVASSVGIWVYDTESGEEHALLPRHRDGFSPSVFSALGAKFIDNRLVFSPDGKLLASASEDDTIRVFDVTTYSEYRTLYKSKKTAVSSFAGTPVKALSFSTDGQTLTSLEGINERRIKVWDIKSGTLLSDVPGRIGEDTPDKNTPTPPSERQENPFVALALSPDGTTFAATMSKIGIFNQNRETDITFGNVHTGKLESPLIKIRSKTPNQPAEPILPIKELMFSPDGTTLAGVEINNSSEKKNSKRIRHIKIRFWDVGTGQEVSTVIPQQSEVNPDMPNFVFSPDGKTFASADRGVPIQLWDVNTGNLISSITIPRPELAPSWYKSSINALAFHPDGNTLAVAAKGRGAGESYSSLQLWEVKTAKLISTLTEHPTLYIIAENDKTLHCMNAGNFELRDINTGRILQDLTQAWMNLTEHIKKLRGVEAFAVSSDNNTCAIGVGDGSLELWDMQVGKPLFTLRGHTDQINALAFSADGTTLASGSKDISIRLWDTRTGTQLLTFTEHKNSGKKQEFPDAPTQLSAELVNNLVFSTDGKTLASSSEHGTIWLWDLSTGNLLKTITTHEEEIDTVYVGTGLAKVSLAFSPDGKFLASGGIEGWVVLSEVNNELSSVSLEPHAWSVKALAFSPDSKLLVSGSRDYSIRLWDVETETKITTLRGHTGDIYTLRFSADGSTLISGSIDGTILLWDPDKITDSD